MDNVKISVIVPCYQNGKTVEKTVNSILAQTERDWELILVDDGSTDDTGEILADTVRLEKNKCFFVAIHNVFRCCVPLSYSRCRNLSRKKPFEHMISHCTG